MWLEQDIAAGNGSVLEFHLKNYGQNFEYQGTSALTIEVNNLIIQFRFCAHVSSRIIQSKLLGGYNSQIRSKIRRSYIQAPRKEV